MSAIVINEQVRIPPWVADFDSFRHWACSEEFPEQGRLSHLNGEIWVDPTMETLLHNLLRYALTKGVGSVVDDNDLGMFLLDRMLLTNLAALLTTEPDGMFISHASLKLGRVELRQGLQTLEVLGTPDAVMEIVSKTSVKKDSEVLRDLYWQAEIPEYWLIDSQQKEVELDILRFTSTKYVSTRKQGGWVKSQVLGKSFRLVSEPGENGITKYSLEYR